MTEHEKALLEAILCDQLVIDRCNVIPEIFESSDARSIFNAFIITRNKNIKLDLISVSDTLKEMVREELTLIVCKLNPFTSVNAEYHVKILRDNMRRRELKPIVADAFNGLRDGAELEDVIQNLSDGIVKSHESANDIDDPSIESNMGKYSKELERRSKTDCMDGANFGISSLDNSIGSGIGDGELIAIAARPGIGKTALAVQMAVHNAIVKKVRTSIFSFEMTRNEVYDRVYSPHVPGGIGTLRMGMIRPSMLEKIETVSSDLYISKFRVYEKSMTPKLLAANIRRDTIVHGTKLFIVDYFGLLDFGHETNIARWEKVGDASKMLKRLAMDLKISIVLCVQLTRGAEGREPTLADLRDSGSIEQDCNRVILLHRIEKEFSTDIGIDAIIAKNRGGPCGRVPLMFIGNKTKFEPMEVRRG